MTHDELLESIDWYLDNDCGQHGCKQIYKALRAVVELHKPFQDNSGWWHCNECDHIGDSGCPTIQAIEKELG